MSVKEIRIVALVFGSILMSNLSLSSQSIYHNPNSHRLDVDSVYRYIWYDNVKDTTQIYIKSIVDSDSLIFTLYEREESSSNMKLSNKAHVSFLNSELALYKTYHKWDGQKYSLERHEERHYDEHKRLINFLSSEWDEDTNSLQPSSLINYSDFEFDQYQRSDHYRYDDEFNQSLWYKDLKESFFMVDGKIDSLVSRKYYTDQEFLWGFFSHTKFIYENDKLTSEVHYEEEINEYIGQPSGILTPYLKWDYQYVDDLETSLLYFWNKEEWVWGLSHKFESFYDEFGRRLEFKSLDYVDGVFIDDEHTLYFYSEAISNTKEEVVESLDFYFFSESSNRLGLYTKNQLEDPVDVLIYTNLGRLKYRTKMEPFQTSINVPIPSGFYEVIFLHADKSTEYLKVIVN